MARETLKSKHRASFYKSEEAWLNAIYRANKALIDAAYEGKGTRGPRAVFKSQVREYKAKGYGTKEAIKIVSNTRAFRPAGVPWYIENAVQGMKSMGVWQQFLNLNRDAQGHFLPFDIYKLKYIGDKVYLYDNRIVIEFRNSPVGIYMYNRAEYYEYATARQVNTGEKDQPLAELLRRPAK